MPITHKLCFFLGHFFSGRDCINHWPGVYAWFVLSCGPPAYRSKAGGTARLKGSHNPFRRYPRLGQGWSWVMRALVAFAHFSGDQ